MEQTQSTKNPVELISFNQVEWEAFARRCSLKKTFLKILQKSQENTCARVSFLIKLQVLAGNFISKGGSDTGVFLWILQNF